MAKTVEEYLALGFDRAAAEYFAAGRKKLVGVEANDDFTLTLTFEGGERRLYDAKPLLQEGTVFAPFRDLRNFRRVYLDAQNDVAWDIDPAVDSEKVWSNKIDLCPDSCYLDSTPIRPAGR